MKKQTNSLKTLAVALAASLGLAASAVAEVPLEAPPVPSSGSMGLLGQTYATLTYSYTDLDDTSVHADTFSASVNQNLHSGLDAILSYDYSDTGTFGGSRLRGQGVGFALRAFSTSYSWGKPYVEAGAGWAWTRYAGTHDDSFAWEAAVGVELQVTPVVTVTPFVQYADAPDLAGDGTWDFGVKANYWVDSRWAVTAGIDRDDDQNTSFTVGTNFRF
jgi:hypothetical protein